MAIDKGASDVTVQQLAQNVGVSTDYLLKQMSAAGLPQRACEDFVTSDQRRLLLNHLSQASPSSSHSKAGIALRTKTSSVLQVKSGTRRSTVQIEVRKKRRIYTAPPVVEEVQPEEKIEEASSVSSAEVPPVESTNDEAVQAQEQVEEAEAQSEKTASAEELQPASDKEKELTAKKPSDWSQPGKQQKKEHTERKPRSSLKQQYHQKNEKNLLRDQQVIDEIADEGSLEKDANVVARQPVIAQRKRQRAKAVALQSMHKFKRPVDPIVHDVVLPTATISVVDLAQKMSIKAIILLRKLLAIGVEVQSVKQHIERETAVLVIEELGHRVKSSVTAVRAQEKQSQQAAVAESRAPVVAVVGHVDHGKTSLLDYIRQAAVVSGEVGGITQRIGAYSVALPQGEITFLDTPGHAAFTAMRARGVRCTDIVVLVVAADDGVMPQTEEAIRHIQAAGVSLVVAMNKIDKENSDLMRLQSDLAAHGIVVEALGGDVQSVPVSAKTGEGIDALLEAILLQAEMLELKAVKEDLASGVILESRLDKHRGPVATLLVQHGVLNTTDLIVSGFTSGKVKLLLDDIGKTIQQAGPSCPVEVLGFNLSPEVGMPFLVKATEKAVRDAVKLHHLEQMDQVSMQKLNQPVVEEAVDATDQFFQAKAAVLNLIIRADLRGSLEAICAALEKMSYNKDVKVELISSAVGNITESDVDLASISKAAIMGFNVAVPSSVRKFADTKGCEIRTYDIIYDFIDDVRRAMESLLGVEIQEKIFGVAEIREVFAFSKSRLIAGCVVTSGVMHKDKKIRLIRDNAVLCQKELLSLRRFKEDVPSVNEGMECGIEIRAYSDVRVGDRLESLELTEVMRTLEVDV